MFLISCLVHRIQIGGGLRFIGIKSYDNSSENLSGSLKEKGKNGTTLRKIQSKQM